MRKDKNKKERNVLFDPEYVENILDEKNIGEARENILYQLKQKLRER